MKSDSLNEYIKSNFLKAVEIQRGFQLDINIVAMIENETFDKRIIIKWMRNYGLFQGLTTIERDKIASTFIKNIPQIKEQVYFENSLDIEKAFILLFNVFYNTIKRQWISATSKLLWCTFPYDIVIYDSFVEKVVSVYQCLSINMTDFPRLGYCPKVNKVNVNTKEIFNYYIRYQNIVKQIYHENLNLIKELKMKHKIEYNYDIRIVDKILWLMGKSDESFSLNGKTCL